MSFFRTAILFFLTVLPLQWATPVAHAQSRVPQYEIIDVRILTYQPKQGWVSREHTKGFLDINKKDWSVRLGRGWIGIDSERYVQTRLTLPELIVLMGAPTEGYDPDTFPFSPDLAGPYIPDDIRAEGDFSSRRWYAQDASVEKGNFLLPVGTSLISLDLFPLEGAPKEDGVAWWARMILYESREGYIEIDPSPKEEGFEFTEDDVRDPESEEDGLEFTEDDVRDDDTDDEGLEFTEQDLQNLSNEDEGLEFTEDHVQGDGAESKGLEFTERDLQELSDEENGLEFTEEDIRDPEAEEEGLEFTEDDVREPTERPMTDSQRDQAAVYRDQLLSCAETGSGCPDGIDPEAVQAEYETNPDGFGELAQEMAEDSVLGVARDADGWPRALPDNEAQQAQEDYEQIQACVSGPSACPDYIHKETAKFFFDNADPESADAAIREIVVKAVSNRTAQQYEVEDQ